MLENNDAHPSRGNHHVGEFVRYYFDLEHPPNYAVLVTGSWGIGKTHLIKNIISSDNDLEKECIYISLYGLSNTDEIDTAIIQAMYPAFEWKSVKVAGVAAKWALKHFASNPDLKINELLAKPSAGIYVFDDLERSNMPVSSVLGYINTLVEHYGAKVIIVANEEEIQNLDEYQRRKEKLIGRTLEVQSELEAALTHFISQVSDANTRDFFKKLSPDISNIYYQSELSNLRILQQTLWDFERLNKVLCDKHRKKKKSMAALLRLFFALSFEFKSGRIQVEDLMSRLSKIVAGQIAKSEGGDQERLLKADARYPELLLHADILPDDLFVDILARGIINGDEIRAVLDTSPHFTEINEHTSWRTLWYLTRLTDAEFEQAYNHVEKQFLNRDFLITGELLHVFGLKLYFADNGLSDQSKAEVVLEAKEYIDDAFEQKKIEPIEAHMSDEFRFEGYGGLGIYCINTDEYKEIYSYLHDKRVLIAENQHPSKAQELLSEMAQDQQFYFRRLNVTNSDDNLYYRVPILASIDPSEFVSTLLKLDPLAQDTVLSAFKPRYDSGQLERDLKSEKVWLLNIRDLITKELDGMSPISRFRMTQFVDWYIDPPLGE